MAVQMNPTVRCDRCQFEVEVLVIGPSERDGREVQRFMRKLEAGGWHFLDTEDIGPKCAALKGVATIETAPETDPGPVSGGKGEWG